MSSGRDNDYGRPNILFLCTDQQRFDALGCYGNTRIQTPNIDRLAADGVVGDIQRVIRVNYAMISFVDDEIGRILATLDQLGLTKNTLVVFTGDHGETLGNHHLLLKGPLFYEGAVRVPLLMRWSGHLPAGELDNLWERLDYRHLRTELEQVLLDVLVATEHRSQPREAVW